MIHRFFLFTPRVKQLSLRMSKMQTDGGTIDDKKINSATPSEAKRRNRFNSNFSN